MNIVDVPSHSASRRRPGRPPLEIDQLRARRLNLDLTGAELLQCQAAAAQAALPVRRWARRVLLGRPVAAALPLELRQIWSESSTLQSNFNQLVSRLDELRVAGSLTTASAHVHLVELLHVVPQLHSLVCSMRVELATARSKS